MKTAIVRSSVMFAENRMDATYFTTRAEYIDEMNLYLRLAGSPELDPDLPLPEADRRAVARLVRRRGR